MYYFIRSNHQTVTPLLRWAHMAMCKQADIWVLFGHPCDYESIEKNIYIYGATNLLKLWTHDFCNWNEFVNETMLKTYDADYWCTQWNVISWYEAARTKFAIQKNFIKMATWKNIKNLNKHHKWIKSSKQTNVVGFRTWPTVTTVGKRKKNLTISVSSSRTLFGFWFASHSTIFMI
jgi:hypothetical protein